MSKPKPEESVQILTKNIDQSSFSRLSINLDAGGDQLYPRYDMASVYHPDPFVSTLSTISYFITHHCLLM